jgi:gamma-glutamylaminecyclotransferase
MASTYDVFVYGTLKRGYPNDQVGLPRASYLGDYQTSERFPLVIASANFVPYLLDEPGEGHHVEGELYRVDNAVLAELDELESVHLPNGYHRREITIAPMDGKADGAPRTAWCYLKHREALGVIHDGPMASYPLDTRYIRSAER